MGELNGHDSVKGEDKDSMLGESVNNDKYSSES